MSLVCLIHSLTERNFDGKRLPSRSFVGPRLIRTLHLLMKDEMCRTMFKKEEQHLSRFGNFSAIRDL